MVIHNDIEHSLCVLVLLQQLDEERGIIERHQRHNGQHGALRRWLHLRLCKLVHRHLEDARNVIVHVDIVDVFEAGEEIFKQRGKHQNVDVIVVDGRLGEGEHHVHEVLIDEVLKRQLIAMRSFDIIDRALHASVELVRPQIDAISLEYFGENLPAINTERVHVKREQVHKVEDLVFVELVIQIFVGEQVADHRLHDLLQFGQQLR
mmetsp:Transcript_3689/g.6205  ORF Transcript_3689/g.6205 Transcript_3689/m.6205 type:complete len:206 (+) Transcript_3689:416-1033(+)